MRPERPALVFVHHQPLPVGSPWIDKYPLIEPERLWQRLDPQIVRIVAFGHVHQAFSGMKDGIACLSAPSTVANSQPGMARFTLGPDGTAVSITIDSLDANGLGTLTRVD